MRLRRLLLPLALATACAPASAHQLYCAIVDLGEDRYYFSKVFEGDYARASELAQQHLAFIRTKTHVGDSHQTLCFFEEKAEDAARERKKKLDEAVEAGALVFESRWPPAD